MDQRSDNEGGRLSPLERIKAQHDLTRRMILSGDEDEIPWQSDMLPEQAGLQQVWADKNGKLWIMERSQAGIKLKRLWHIV
jgi:hypothetical protein